jgi:hypothetical protein
VLNEKKYILEGNIESSPVPEIEKKHCPFIVYACMYIHRFFKCNNMCYIVVQ